MLNYDELVNIGRLKRLSPINTEKDYLQDIVLLSIYSRVGNELVFKGGTCLYKVYGLDRFSEDLDFTLSKKYTIKKLTENIIRDIDLFNIKCRIKEIKEYKNEINVRMLFNGPLYRGSKAMQCFIPLNISLREKIVLDAKKETIRPIYREVPTFDVFAMREEEILAEKIRAILTRDKPRDVYDLWFLLKYKGISINLKLVDKKLKYYDIIFNRKDLIDGIKRKKQLWNSDLKNLIIGELPDFDEVVRGVSDALEDDEG